MIGKYCGQSTPPSFISSSHQVFLHFESVGDSIIINSNNGFKLEYHAFSKLSFSQREAVASAFLKKNLKIVNLKWHIRKVNFQYIRLHMLYNANSVVDFCQNELYMTFAVAFFSIPRNNAM